MLQQLRFFLVLLCAAVALNSQSSAALPVGSSIIGGKGLIFVAEIRSAQPGPRSVSPSGLRNRATNVHVRILRVLKPANGMPYADKEFDAEITQSTGYGAHMVSPWWGLNIEAGQRYLILGRSDIVDLRTALTLALRPMPITDTEDPSADAELILAAEPLSLQSQALALASGVIGSRLSRSYLFADYAAALLRAGSDPDTAELSQAIEQSPVTAFSETAKTVLLTGLRPDPHSIPHPSHNLMHTYVVMTARWLAIESHPQDELSEDPRSDILDLHIPTILDSEQTKAVLRGALPPAVNREFQKEVLDIIAGGNLNPDQITRLRSFASQVAAQ